MSKRKYWHKILSFEKLKVNQHDIKDVTIHKMSIDARSKKMFAYVYDLDVTIDNENKYVGKDVILVENEDYVLPRMGNNILSNRPIVVGAGPAGLFCTYMLAKYGYKPILIERGEKLKIVLKALENFGKIINLLKIAMFSLEKEELVPSVMEN